MSRIVGLDLPPCVYLYSGLNVAGQQTSGRIRVLVVDDHPMLRDGIAAVLGSESDIDIVGEATNGLEAIEEFKNLLPDVVLMDIQMPGIDGIEAIERIRIESPGARIIILTTYAGDAQALRALRAGAVGYLLKSSMRKELLEAIRAAHAGNRSVAPSVAQEIALFATATSLSEREIAVLRGVASGHANKNIGRSLSISEDMVKAHLKNIFVKLDVTDRTRAVTVALKRGIITI